jgi:hypothetical protein
VIGAIGCEYSGSGLGVMVYFPFAGGFGLQAGQHFSQ